MLQLREATFAVLSEAVLDRWCHCDWCWLLTVINFWAVTIITWGFKVAMKWLIFAWKKGRVYVIPPPPPRGEEKALHPALKISKLFRKVQGSSSITLVLEEKLALAVYPEFYQTETLITVREKAHLLEQIGTKSCWWVLLSPNVL